MRRILPVAIELAGGELGRCDMLGRLDDGHAER
jgi:hypothetical protein